MTKINLIILNSIVSILILIFTAIPVFSYIAPHFIIENYNSEIVINEIGLIDVTETIEVVFDFKKHGIFRDIPFRSNNEYGEKKYQPLKIISVTNQNGDRWKYETKINGDILNIRIGDINTFVDGKQIYVIHYQIERAVLFFEEYDELYWNVTGNSWPVEIKNITADVRINSPTVSNNIITYCYTGRYGSKDSACSVITSNNEARFTSTVPQLPGGGITISFSWDKGIVIPPTENQKLLWSLSPEENWVFLFPIFTFICLLIAWFISGRDPRHDFLSDINYNPPMLNGKTITAAQAGALIDDSLDHRDLIGSIVGIASKGYIKINKNDKNNKSTLRVFSIIKLKEPDNKLTKFESVMMEMLFLDDNKEAPYWRFNNVFYNNLHQLRQIMFTELTDLKCYKSDPLKIIIKYKTFGLWIGLTLALIFSFLSPYSLIKGISAGILTGLLLIIFSKIMPSKTKIGVNLKKEILGFQKFLMETEKNNITGMSGNNFYNFLPFAISLDVVDNWVENCRILNLELPSWYSSSQLSGSFHPEEFIRSISEIRDTISSSIYSSPRGTNSTTETRGGLFGSGSGFGGGGSGGGGFSGGGSGGGGGGSW